MFTKVGQEVLIFDGGFGTELEKRGLMGKVPELLNITHPNDIAAIHKEYIEAGCDFITTNTFGANRIKLPKENIPLLIDRAIQNAKRYRTTQHIMMDIGPLGKMLYPMGKLHFDEAYEAFKEMVIIARDQVDGFILETFSDLYELKCAVLAVKENCDKPLFTTMTFDSSGHTLTGTTPRIMAELMSNMNVNALGVNCSLGPQELKPIVDEFLQYSDKPIVVQPNCGIPTLCDGRASYSLTSDRFASYMTDYCKAGVAIIGGCCGTNPDFIRAIAVNKGLSVPPRTITRTTVVASSTRLVEMTGVQICGERINPTGKKKLKEAILEKNWDYLFKEAIKQEQAGAQLLDVNLGIPKTDEVAHMKEVVTQLGKITSLPLQIDSSDVQTLEAGCRYYNGIPLINSVNGTRANMEAIFPIAKKYGTVVLGLTMDDNGIPSTAEDRLVIAHRIVDYAEKFNIPRHRMMIDPLTLTCSAQQSLVKETLRALRLVREQMGIATALGISNVSFGMPNRTLINRTFLALALENGLTMPIINPCDANMIDTVLAFHALKGETEDLNRFIEQTVASGNTIVAPTEMNLAEAVRRGLKEESISLTKHAIQIQQPLEIINQILIPTLNEVWNDFEKQKIFLPQLLAASEACKEAFSIIKEKFEHPTDVKGIVLLATVKGDVHDMGKNIVKVIFESYGYKVIDLGKDTSKEAILQAAEKYHPCVIGLSALMTTTVPSMEETISYLKKQGITIPIFVGGAVLNQLLANQIHADGYTKDALEFVETINQMV